MIVLATIIGAFAALWLMLSGLDRIAKARGLGAAHPLSPVVAWTLLLWSLLFLVALVYAIHVDGPTTGLPTPPSRGEGE